MGYDFDEVISRRGSDSAKWGRYASDPDVIPAWVADMDFACPPPVLEALRGRVDHGVFGYAYPPAELIEVTLARLRRLYDWSVDPEWLVVQPGVVPGLYLACQCAGEPGDAVLTPTPAYHHFLQAPAHSGRELVPLPCLREGGGEDGRWELALDTFEETLTPRTRLLLLCNPYNPLGRILTRSELETLAGLCVEHDLLICSDEIHCELLLDRDKPHIPFATLNDAVAERSITLVSPSKPFNLPGIGGFSLAIIPNAELRQAFRERAHGVTVHPGGLAYQAALGAWRDCDDWLAALLTYLSGNRDLLEREIGAIPGLSMTHVETTYLAWIDFARSGLERPAEALLAHGVALTNGAELGDPTHLRLNFGCPRSTLEEILRRIRRAVDAGG